MWTTMELFVCRYGVEERILYIKTNIVCITIFKETPFQVGVLLGHHNDEYCWVTIMMSIAGSP